MRSAMAAAPFLLLIALAPMLRPKTAPPVGSRTFALFAGLAILIGLLVGFGVPLSNHYTRRRVRIGQEHITVWSGYQPRASQRQKPIIATYERDQIAAVQFERQPIKGRNVDVMRIRMQLGNELIIGIGPKESVDDVRSHMQQWRYPVA